MGIQLPGANRIEQFTKMLDQNLCPLRVVKNIGTPKNPDLVMGIIEHQVLEQPQFKRYTRVSKLAIAAAEEALQTAAIKNKDHRRVCVIFGTSVGGLTEVEELAKYATQENFRNYPVTGVSSGNIGSLAIAVGAHVKANHLQLTLGNTCTASTDAIILGKQLLEENLTDICIVGGAESPINRTLTYGFAKMKALAVEEDVREAGMPFSTSTKGFVISEGAGALILEREEDAMQREAEIFGFIENGFSNNDNISTYESDQTGDKMTIVLKKICGGQEPTYINSQALGLMENDMVEAAAYRNCYDGRVPITSIKGLIGHTFAASGVVQTIASLISMKEQFIPATYGTNKKGFESLPIVTKKQQQHIESVAVTTHGFGGSNTGLLIRNMRVR
ncbi:hypothetical protein BTO28_13720 [Domibacillus epiphyticus]|uniref:Ketosynthase family 3 (KS3) domain-containing protein n=2 Tax=Domibacillus epiphyticus TaxID=1714355 RepID=A0A1V2A5T7_9BACI|nr:hypothetical protein BTO28_13720 [Domibacillus epiphyticus]